MVVIICGRSSTSTSNSSLLVILVAAAAAATTGITFISTTGTVTAATICIARCIPITEGTPNQIIAIQRIQVVALGSAADNTNHFHLPLFGHPSAFVV